MIKIPFFLIFYFIITSINAQPYIDVLSVGYIRSPDGGIFRRNYTINNFNYYSAGINLPIILKKDSSIIVFSPFVEHWNIHIDSLNEVPNLVQSLAFGVSLIKPFTRKTTFAISLIPRWNGYRSAIFKNDFQLGGAALISYKKKNNLIYKLGLYYNSELSGAYFVPLFGIDWRINNKNNLFGILPGSLVFEHKSKAFFYWGASFNAVTNTYDAGFVNNGNVPKYLRVEDNQLSVFSDFYFLKNIVLHVEAGHSLMRAFKFGKIDDDEKYYYTASMNDDIVMKLSINYRIRF